MQKVTLLYNTNLQWIFVNSFQKMQADFSRNLNNRKNIKKRLCSCDDDRKSHDI